MRRILPSEERPHHLHAGVDANDFRRDGRYENWRSRGTCDWLLIFTMAGSGRVGTEKMEIVCKPGTVALYEPGTPQYYYTDPEVGKWHLLWAHFHPRVDWMPWLRWERVNSGLCFARLEEAAAVQGVRSSLRECVRHCRKEGMRPTEFAMNALERALLWVHFSGPHPEWDPRVAKALEIFLRKIREPILLPDLAAQCGLSVSRLTQLFVRDTGLTPQRYLESLRLRRATHLLRSSQMTIAEVARESGYQDAFYFSNRFRRAFGRSPTEFRRLAEGVIAP